jgi:hypothetical protein
VPLAVAAMTDHLQDRGYRQTITMTDGKPWSVTYRRITRGIGTLSEADRSIEFLILTTSNPGYLQRTDGCQWSYGDPQLEFRDHFSEHCSGAENPRCPPPKGQ